MIKIFLLCVIFCCCILIGLKIKEYLKRRMDFYNNFCLFCEILKNKISFKNEKLTLILQEHVNDVTNRDFKIFLNLYLSFTKNIITKLDFQKKIQKELCFLTKDEKQELFSFLYNVGSFSKEEELSNISNYLTKSSVKFNEAKSSYAKFSNLYLKLFIILGLMLFVIFI